MTLFYNHTHALMMVFSCPVVFTCNFVFATAQHYKLKRIIFLVERKSSAGPWWEVHSYSPSARSNQELRPVMASHSRFVECWCEFIWKACVVCRQNNRSAYSMMACSNAPLIFYCWEEKSFSRPRNNNHVKINRKAKHSPCHTLWKLCYKNRVGPCFIIHSNQSAPLGLWCQTYFHPVARCCQIVV